MAGGAEQDEDLPWSSFRRRLLLGILSAATMGGRASADSGAIRIGALAGPYAELFGFVRGLALGRGLTIQVVTSSDAEALYRAAASGNLQAAAAGNTPALQAANAAHGYGLAAAFATVTLPVGIYSRHVHAPTQLKAGDTIVLPDVPIERDRARVLLYNYGLLRAHEDDGLTPDFSNIVNPFGFRLEEVAPARLPARMSDAGAVLMPYDVAVAASLHPARDSIGLEDGRSPYAGVLAVRAAMRGAPWVETLGRVFHSREMRRFIYDTYGDGVEPPW